MNTEANIDILIIKSFEETLTNLDKSTLESWLASDIENEKHYDDLKNIWDNASHVEDLPTINIDSEWNRFKSNNFSQEKGRVFSLFSRASLKYAAVILLALFSGSIYLLSSKTYQTQNERQTISLSDGSIVQLNTHSSLEVSRMYNWFNRSMNLDGEAYFDVAKNPNKPFIIHSERANIEVLGTSFNFNSKSVNPKVSVTSGRVAFWNGNRDEAIYLLKGDEGVLKGEKLSQQKIEDNNFLGWYDGNFDFKNEKLSSSLERLASYYQIEFEIENLEEVKDCNLTAQFHQNTLDEVLAELEILMNFKIEKINNTYHLKNGFCL